MDKEGGSIMTLLYGSSFPSSSLVGCNYLGNYLRRVCFSIKSIFFTKISNFFTSGMSAFFNHIGDVVRLCSQKQMIWPYTNGIVALVQTMERFVWFSIVKPIRGAMGSCGKSFSNWVSRYFYTNSAIPMSIDTSSPNPTMFGFFNKWPKFNFNFFNGKHAIPSSLSMTESQGGW